jgi:5-methylcytosine-specific restriction endonuclease McrA
MKYKDQLRDPRWKTLRNKIVKRDGKKCTKCDHTRMLQVHHTYYTGGKLAWEYPDSCLVTLCARCHKLEHGIKTKKPRTTKS